jgi:hypothetical protein
LSTAPGLFDSFNDRRTKSESQGQSSVGTGVICETWVLEAAVIPARTGIWSFYVPPANIHLLPLNHPFFNNIPALSG